MSKKMDSPSQETLNGISFHRSGNSEAAAQWYREAIRKNPKEYEAWHLLGVLAAQQNQKEEAIKLINKSLLINQKNLDALNNLGLVFFESQNYGEAIQCYEKIIFIDKNYGNAWYNKGNALQSLFKFEEAIACYDQAIALHPTWIQAINNKGNALQSLFKFEEAIACYDQAIALDNVYEDAYYNKGVSLQHLRKLADAIQNYEKVISLNPSNIDSLNNLGDIYLELDEEYKAKQKYTEAIFIDPNYIAAQLGLVASTIPRIQDPTQSTLNIRAQFEQRLDELTGLIKNVNNPQDINIIGLHHPFLLAYHDKNNRSLLQKYGLIYQKLAQPFQEAINQRQPRKTQKEKISIGIVGSHFYNHSVWGAITKGLLKNLDRSKFTTHLFSTSSKADDETVLAKNSVESFFSHSSLQDLISSILEKDIDAIIFPEIGMDKLTIQIASLRLAPIQIAAWGHPETTGIPTIDYFMSGELFEQKNYCENYTEIALPLKNLGCYIEPYSGPIKEVNLFDFGINPDEPRLLCPGAPFKYRPDYDGVLLEISRQNPSAQFIFFEFPNSGADRFKQRLLDRFAFEGLQQNIQNLKFIPLLDGPHFRGLMKQMTLYLDTIGFSGFNTALQAIESNLPIITREGDFMRGNLASGLLKCIGMSNLIARDESSYIKLAKDLISNPQLLKECSEVIEKNKSIIFYDTSPMQELEMFLLDKCSSRGIQN
jgi:protein O-GlcNAc transferase